MYRFYLAAVDVIPAAVVLVPLFLILYVTAFERNLIKSGMYCLFSLYLSAIFSLVGLPNVLYVRPEINLNLIPLLGIIEDLSNSLLNVLLFIPLGLFLPVIWLRYRNIKSTVAFGIGLSIMIELLQMLTFRATDVNDLITNTAGTAIGFLLIQPIICKLPAVEQGKREAYALLAAAFGVMFFLHPFLSTVIWDSIL